MLTLLLGCGGPDLLVGDVVDADGRVRALPVVATDADGAPCGRAMAGADGRFVMPVRCDGPTVPRVDAPGWGTVDAAPCRSGCTVRAARLPPADGVWIAEAEALRSLLARTPLERATDVGGETATYPAALPHDLPTLDGGDRLLVRGDAPLEWTPLVQGPPRRLVGPPPVDRGEWPEFGSAVPPPGAVVAVDGHPVRRVAPDELAPGLWLVRAPGAERGVLLAVATR